MDKTNLFEHILVAAKTFAKKVVLIGSSGDIVNPSTSEKQDTILTELQQKTEPTDIQLGELIPVLRSLILAIANPSYVDKSLNSIRIGNNTVTFAANQDIRTVTTVTNLGSFPADHLQRMDNMTAWQTGVRRLIS